MVLMILDSCSSRPEAVNTSTLITSQVLEQSLSPAQAENKGTASATGLTSAASDDLPARRPVVVKKDVPAMDWHNRTTVQHRSGKLAEQVIFGIGVNRSRMYEGGITVQLHVRKGVMPH